MPKAISYSLFGWNKVNINDKESVSGFESFIRGFHMSIRFARVLFPGWKVVLNIDESTYNSPYKDLFDFHKDSGFCELVLFQDNEPICRGMLRRLQTVFAYDHPQWRYSHVILRDLDSLPTYRDAQMVQEWIDEDRAMHCITDSISHTVHMMGGMVGFRPGYIKDLLQLNTTPETSWQKLLSLDTSFNYNTKGTDQSFMNKVMYPRLCKNATEHFLLGMPHDLLENNGRHYRCPDGLIPEGVDPKYRELIGDTYHVGAAGFKEKETIKFLFSHDPFRDEYLPIETMKGFETICYWQGRPDLR